MRAFWSQILFAYPGILRNRCMFPEQPVRQIRPSATQSSSDRHKYRPMAPRWLYVFHARFRLVFAHVQIYLRFRLK